MTSRARRNFIVTAKWGFYLLALLVAATLQTTPGFLTIGQVRPVFILPVCVAVAVFEGEYPGAVFGAVGGLLWDLTAGRVPGLIALEMMFVCFLAAAVVELYLRVNVMNFILVNGCCCLAVLSIDFLFYYLMPGYAGASQRYMNVILPMVVFTAALSPVAMLVARTVHRRLRPTD